MSAQILFKIIQFLFLNNNNEFVNFCLIWMLSSLLIYHRVNSCKSDKEKIRNKFFSITHVLIQKYAIFNDLFVLDFSIFSENYILRIYLMII